MRGPGRQLGAAAAEVPAARLRGGHLHGRQLEAVAL